MPPFVASLDRRLGVVEAAFAGVAIAMLLAIAAFVCIDVGLRYLLNRPLSWVTEVSEIALVYITFFGASWVLRHNGHVNVDILVSSLSNRSQALCQIAGHAIGLTVCVILVVYGISATWSAYARGLFKPTTLSAPTWLTLAPIPIGSALLSLRFALEMFRAWIAYRTGRPVHAQATTSVE
jgi:TRAP-type C4-dicarboxylate transport system permease small subunit